MKVLHSVLPPFFPLSVGGKGGGRAVKFSILAKRGGGVTLFEILGRVSKKGGVDFFRGC